MTSNTKSTFQLSALLHDLTKLVLPNLKKHNNTIYYDIQKEVSRYIVADYVTLRKTLEELLSFFSNCNAQAEIILSIEKSSNSSLRFKLSNESPLLKMNKEMNLPTLMYAKQYSDIRFSKSQTGKGECEFTIPYIADAEQQSYRSKLNGILEGKKALLVSRNSSELRIATYAFETFGIEIESITSEAFASTKPDFSYYDMAIVKSSELTVRQVSVFKSIHQEHPEFKTIVIHDLFVSREEKDFASSIACAEIFRPTIIGDVEEILKKLFIEKVSLLDTPKDSSTKKLKEFKRSKKKITFTPNILLVHCNAIERKMINTILNREQAVIFIAKNTIEALKIMNEKKIDIIFTGIRTSIEEAIEFTNALKKVNMHKQIPLVAISSLIEEHELLNIKDHGFSGHIPVPYKHEHFHNAIKKFTKAS